MHIRPYVVLASAGLCATAALIVIVAQQDPYAASSAVTILFWAVLFLSCWGWTSALVSWIGRRLPLAVLTGLGYAIVMTIGTVVVQAGSLDIRLLGGVGFATLIFIIVVLRKPIKDTPHA